jgi:hypothetical protein
LQTFETKKQVEKYIDECLTHSATFQIVKDTLNFGDDNNEYFYDKKQEFIKHFVYAKENSEAGNYYNKRTINAILNMYTIETNKKHYDYKNTISEHFNYMGPLMFGLKPSTKLQLEEINYEANKEDSKISDKNTTLNNSENPSVNNSSVNQNLVKHKSKLIYKGKEKLILQKMVIDELGITSFIKNDFNPDYEMYYNKNELVIIIECPEGVKLSAKRKRNKGGDYPFGIEIIGEKIEEKKIEDVKYMKTKTSGKFYALIPFTDNEYALGKGREEESKNGWKKFIFPLVKVEDD